jgi:two-component system CheB/CheR fusion protein
LEFEAFLTYLKQVRGFDFTHYKRSSLLRRVSVRMQRSAVKGGLADYVEVLQSDPREFARLFGTIFINHTGFFRDPAAWDYLRDALVPRLVGEPGPEAPIRVWSAGCASGEEAYSIAMLLAEALGLEALRHRVKIYATDIDEEALALARRATYTARSAQAVPPALLQRYFERRDDGYAVRRELRRSVVFGRHDLIHDAPIPRIDLLICRNCLMYFNAGAQAHILGRFEPALEPGGALFLGQAETVPRRSALEPENAALRIFVKPGRSAARSGVSAASPARSDFVGLPAATPGDGGP